MCSRGGASENMDVESIGELNVKMGREPNANVMGELNLMRSQQVIAKTGQGVNVKLRGERNRT